MPIPEILDDNIADETYDWITWETLGNPSDLFQKGNSLRQFGLWRASYETMAKGGMRIGKKADWPDGVLGRGYLRVYTLSEVNYNDHKALIDTFLPCMKVDKFNNGGIIDPLSTKIAPLKDVLPDYVVFPFNVDDNDARSPALGNKLNQLQHLGAEKLQDTLPRWSTASRSNIVPIGMKKVDCTVVAQNQQWQQRGQAILESAKAAIKRDTVLGTLDQTTYESTKNSGYQYYSVKTGVQWVGMADQSNTGKTYLEDGYDLAMNRSNLVAWVRNVYGEWSLDARYQIELLTVVVDREPTQAQIDHKWDGFQVRELGDPTGQAWYPGTAIPNFGKAFAAKFGATQDWLTFWKTHFAQPLGRAKAEMIVMFGLQLQGNAQNMLVAFDRTTKKSQLIVRDIGDALLNDHVYAALDQVGTFNTVYTLEKNSGRGFFVVTNDIGEPNDAMPQMTRIGTALLFFFGPFIQKDLTIDIATQLAISHHQAFLDYMEERIGYKFDGKASNGSAPVGLKAALLKCADNYKHAEYSPLVEAVLACPASARLALYNELLQETNGNIGQGKSLGVMRALCAAQDMLIGADLECYLKSQAGKTALTKLHSKMALNKAVVLYVPK